MDVAGGVPVEPMNTVTDRSASTLAAVVSGITSPGLVQMPNTSPGKSQPPEVPCDEVVRADRRVVKRPPAQGLRDARVAEAQPEERPQRLPDAAPLSVNEVLRWPGAVRSQALSQDELNDAVLAGMRATLDDLVESRRREGTRLRQHMVRGRLDSRASPSV